MKKPSGDFFRTPTEASLRKQRIVLKYHATWSQVLRARPGTPSRYRENIAYVDLFAGPGQYGDGTKSTALLIIEAAARDPWMREHLLTRFNEGDPALKERLEKNVSASEAANSLAHRPKVTCELVENNILREIGGVPDCPTLLFADPWGYKGLSVKLLTQFLRPVRERSHFLFQLQPNCEWTSCFCAGRTD